MIENRNKIKNLSATGIAFLAGELGKLDLAFEFLSPSIWADPRFKDVLAKMKLDV